MTAVSREALLKRQAGLLPHVVFVGETGHVVQNGVVVQERDITVAGIGPAATATSRRSLSLRLDAEPAPFCGRGAAPALALCRAWQVAMKAGY